MMKMKKALFLIIILFSSCFQFAFAATDEGYGEDQTALGQFVDSFENYNNITVIEDLIVNMTLECVELNYTDGVKENENFTSYIEFDTQGRVTVFEDGIDFIQMRRDDDCYVYYDYGVDFWDDFQIEFNMKINDTEAGDVDNRWINSAVCISSWVGDFAAKPGGYDTINVFIRDNLANDDKFIITLWAAENGAGLGESQGKIRNVSNNKLYLRFNRTDDDIYLWVYTDSDFTVLDETLSLLNTGLTEPIRYIYGVQTVDSAIDGNIWMSGQVEDLWLGNYTGGYLDDGYFITDDYLNDTVCNGTALGLMVNSTIPWNTDIQVQFSNDNVTWGDWEGIPLDSNILAGGFETIDLRYLNETDVYLRFNLSTTDSSLTPRIYQSRIISTIGNQTGGAIPGPSGGEAIGLIMLILICSPFILLVVWRSKRR